MLSFLTSTFMSSGMQTLLPGFGRPLNYIPAKSDDDYVGNLFPNALSKLDIEGGKIAQTLLTLRELAMLHFMNSVTDKPDWYTKINNEEIAQKWKEEAINAEHDITPIMADWCIDELRHKASRFTNSPASPPPIVVYNGDVVKSDTAVPVDLMQALQKAVRSFESAIPDKLKDWHPGSDGKVWDLVHPSLFPVVYGRTRVLPNKETTTLEDCINRCGHGTTAPVPPGKETNEIGSLGDLHHAHAQSNDTPFSAKFQWLPCEVDVSGDNARITSYINNLHPQKEKNLYGHMEKLIDASIPLWNITLAPLSDTKFTRDIRIQFTDIEYDPDPTTWPESEQLQQDPGEDEDDFWDRQQEWIAEKRRLVLPEPEPPFKPLAEPAAFNLKEKYGNRGLQVIVKLANIELTPEKPEYEGGSWHVEGQMNEHIVATSLYYYSCDNITTSTLSFKQQCDPEDVNEMPYEQNDHAWLFDVYGCESDGPGVQDVGGVETHEGRLLTFPNILQHRVGPFKLADPTKSGHRKIVALFLVDPNIKIISSAHVPCQQQEWWWEVVMAGGSALKGTPGRRIPAVADIPIELQDNILGGVDFPYSLDEAKALRLELMEERKKFVVHHGKEFESSEFSLCEH